MPVSPLLPHDDDFFLPHCSEVANSPIQLPTAPRRPAGGPLVVGLVPGTDVPLIRLSQPPRRPPSRRAAFVVLWKWK